MTETPLLTFILVATVLISLALVVTGIVEFALHQKRVRLHKNKEKEMVERTMNQVKRAFTKSKEKEMDIVITEGREFKFALGVEVKDVITGFEGVVTRRTQWLNNCNTYGVQPRKLKDGAIQECSNFDEPQLVLVPAVEPIQPSRSTGGPDRPVPVPGRM